MSERLQVELYETLLGSLGRDGDGRALLHWTADAERRWGLNSPALSAGLRVGVVSAEASEAFFGALLPEGEHIARLAREVKVDRSDVVGLLAAVGADLAGALRIRPNGARSADGPTDPETLDGARVSALLDRADGFLIGGGGSALPGFQRKLTLTRIDGAWLRGNGVLPSTHILKPVGSEHRAAVEAEQYALALGRGAGLVTFDSWVETIGERNVLIIERYDRERAGGGITRIHQEDAAQALGIPWGGNEKFEQHDARASLRAVAGLLDRRATVFGPRRSDRETLLRYTVFNVAIGNTDAHAKNFSLLHPEDGTTRLAPLYDVAPLALAYEATEMLSMHVNGVRRLPDVTLDDLVAEGESWGISASRAREIAAETLDSLIDTVYRTPAHPSIEAHVPGYVTGQARNLLAGEPARIASHIPLALRTRLGTPQLPDSADDAAPH